MPGQEVVLCRPQAVACANANANANSDASANANANSNANAGTNADADADADAGPGDDSPAEHPVRPLPLAEGVQEGPQREIRQGYLTNLAYFAMEKLAYSVGLQSKNHYK